MPEELAWPYAAGILLLGVALLWVYLFASVRMEAIRTWWDGGDVPKPGSASASEMVKHLKWHANRPRWRLSRALRWPMRKWTAARRYVVRFYQRGRHGWSVEDAIGGDYYLAKVIAGITGWMSTHTHSYPVDLTYEQWVAMLKVVSEEFGAHAEDADHNIPYGVKQSFAKWFEDLWA